MLDTSREELRSRLVRMRRGMLLVVGVTVAGVVGSDGWGVPAVALIVNLAVWCTWVIHVNRLLGSVTSLTERSERLRATEPTEPP